jgi:hypothetical protein
MNKKATHTIFFYFYVLGDRPGVQDFGASSDPPKKKINASGTLGGEAVRAGGEGERTKNKKNKRAQRAKRKMKKKKKKGANMQMRMQMHKT